MSDTPSDTPVLTLETMISRPVIQIDRVRHEISSPEELSLVDTARVAALGRRHEKLMKSDRLTVAESRELGDLLDEICDIVMRPISTVVREKLSGMQKMSVIEVFTLLSLARRAKLAGALAGSQMPKLAKAGQAAMDQVKARMVNVEPPIGAEPSVGSSDFMADGPATG